jgi:hypothetical protein
MFNAVLSGADVAAVGTMLPDKSVTGSETSIEHFVIEPVVTVVLEHRPVLPNDTLPSTPVGL